MICYKSSSGCYMLLDFRTCFLHFDYRPQGLREDHNTTGPPINCQSLKGCRKDGLKSKPLTVAGVVIEIGFNAGHSSLLMLAAHPTLHVVAFDLCEHSYTRQFTELLMSKWVSFTFSSAPDAQNLRHVAFSSFFPPFSFEFKIRIIRNLKLSQIHPICILYTYQYPIILIDRAGRPCFNILAEAFPGRLQLVPGRSQQTLPRWARENYLRADLIHIDGAHESEAMRNFTPNVEYINWIQLI